MGLSVAEQFPINKLNLWLPRQNEHLIVPLNRTVLNRFVCRNLRPSEALVSTGRLPVKHLGHVRTERTQRGRGRQTCSAQSTDHSCCSSHSVFDALFIRNQRKFLCDVNICQTLLCDLLLAEHRTQAEFPSGREVVAECVENMKSKLCTLGLSPPLSSLSEPQSRCTLTTSQWT